MKVSVVICTYRRPDIAKKLLLELQKQIYNDFEVIVVSQGDTKDLQKIRDSVKTTYPVRYYYETIANLPRARNIGIQKSSGKVIVFLDDDTRPSSTLIEAHIANYIDSMVGMVGGRVLGEKYQQDVPDHKIGTIREFDGFIYRGFHKKVRRDVIHVKGVNMSVRRDVALEIEGFDERFEGVALYEDLDFCLRVFKKGYRIIFDPKAVVEHFVYPSGGCRRVSKEEAIYWLYRNHNLLFLNNFNILFYPFLITEYIVRIFLRSFRWCNLKIIGSAYRGIYDGWKAHFSKKRRAG